MVTREEIGRRIREAREELRLSQSDLGRKMSRQRSYAAISDIERGKSSIPADELVEVARILGKDITFFIGGRPAPSIVYRRGDRGLTSDQQRETDQAIRRFQELAREQARRREKGG